MSVILCDQETEEFFNCGHTIWHNICRSNDKSNADNNNAKGASYDATININPSLGTEILSGLNVFAGASSIQAVKQNFTNVDDKYEAVGGATYDIGPLSLGVQWSGDYTGVDDDRIERSPSLDVFEKTIDYFLSKLDELFPKERDKYVAESILYLCKNKDQIDNFNKKALYIMIREMTDVKTSKITQISNVFRKIYPTIQEEVLSKGHINSLTQTSSSSV